MDTWLNSGYAGHKNVKYLGHETTFAEAWKIAAGTHVFFVDNKGEIRSAKVTSRKVWKTRPHDLTLKLKYGLYEYFSVQFRGQNRISMDRLWTTVETLAE